MEVTGASGARAPFYQRGSFWLGPFAWGLGLVIAIGLGAAWYTLGGFPRDHDKYGEVSVPGSAVLALPAGDVRLNFENHATHSGDSTTLDDRPSGLDVRVRAAEGGQPLAIDDVPSWLFSSTSGSRGHEPYGKIDVPSAGPYLVEATDDASGGFKKGGYNLVFQDPPPSVDSGPAISVGQSPWTPGDSKVLGAILCGVVVMALVLALTLPFRRFLPD
jgi:hypothetical protein